MKAPSGPRHARCELHVPHPYPSSGWLCMDDPSRADAMRAFADLIAEVAARHHAAETERAGVPTDGALVPHSFSYPRLDTSSQCVGHQCRALEMIVPPEPAAQQPIKARKARKPSPAIRAQRATVEPCVYALCTTPNDPSTHHGPSAHMRVTSGDYTAAELASGDPDLRIRTTRPTCERCGQSFRLSGIGYAWHVKNRLNCKKEPTDDR